MHERTTNILILVVTILVCFLILETTARIVLPYSSERENIYETIYEYDSTLGWKAKPHVVVNFSIPAGTTVVRTNADGFRTHEFSPTTESIVVLGDSQTWGYGVENNETFPAQLEQRVDATVFNLGMTGYGTVQQYLALQEHIDTLQPDTVILAIFINDFTENVFSNNDVPYSYPRPVAELSEGGIEYANIPVPRREQLEPEYGPVTRTLFKSRLVYFVAQGLYRGIDNFLFNAGVAEPELPGDFNHTIRVMNTLIDQIEEELAARDADLLVVMLPVKGRAGTPTVEAYYAAVCSHRENCLNLFDADVQDKYLPFDSHLAPDGHAVIADAIAETLLSPE